MHLHDIQDKVLRTLKGCETKQQAQAAKKFARLWLNILYSIDSDEDVVVECIVEVISTMSDVEDKWNPETEEA